MKKELLNPLYWKKSVLLGLLAAVVVIWIAFIDTYSVLTRVQLEWRKAELIEETHQLEIRKEQLQKSLQEISGDKALEKIAREEYGMRKPGETVYKIEKK